MKNHFQRMLSILTISLFLGMIGCGSHESADDDSKDNSTPIQKPTSVPQPSQTTQPKAAPPPTPHTEPTKKNDPQFSVEWLVNESSGKTETLSRTLSKEGNRDHAFKVDAPVTLWEYCPDSIDLLIQNLPFNFKDVPNKLKASITGNSTFHSGSSTLKISSEFVSYDKMADGLSNIRVTPSGLKGMLNLGSDDEEKLFASLRLSSGDSDQDALTIDFVLMTPPSKLIYTQKSIAEFESANHTLDDKIKFLDSDSLKLFLIQVVELQNLSDQPLSVELSTRIYGRLWQKSSWTDPQYGSFAKEMCIDAPKAIETTDVYSTDFILLPLNDVLSSQWRKLTNNVANSIEMLPQERSLFGIYAIPTKSFERDYKTLLSTRSPKQFAKNNPKRQVTINVGCNFECCSFDFTDAFKNQCKAIPANQPSMRKECDNRVSECIQCSNSSVPIWKKMNCSKCYSDELIEGLSTILSYQGSSACPAGWQRRVVKAKTVTEGMELGSIHLDIRSGDTLSNVQFANVPRESDPSARLLEILKASAVQDE